MQIIFLYLKLMIRAHYIPCSRKIERRHIPEYKTLSEIPKFLTSLYTLQQIQLFVEFMCFLKMKTFALWQPVSIH